MNRICLIGRLTKAPELRTTNTGKNVVEFTVAVDKRIKTHDPSQPTADFFRCKAWNQTADYLSGYGDKGRLVSVDGRLETRKYVDKDGNNREVVEVVADNVSLLDKPKDGDQPAQSTPQPASGGYRAPAAKPANADDYDPFESA